LNAISIFKSGSGTQWDSTIVDALFLARDDINEIVSNSYDGQPADVGARVAVGARVGVGTRVGVGPLK
jgi:hypothetical protein